MTLPLQCWLATHFLLLSTAGLQLLQFAACVSFNQEHQDPLSIKKIAQWAFSHHLHPSASPVRQLCQPGSKAGAPAATPLLTLPLTTLSAIQSAVNTPSTPRARSHLRAENKDRGAEQQRCNPGQQRLCVSERCQMKCRWDAMTGWNFWVRSEHGH